MEARPGVKLNFGSRALAHARAPSYTTTVSDSSTLRGRSARASTPAIIFGSLFIALGLTALGDQQAQANRKPVRRHLSTVEHKDTTELRVLDWTLWNISKYYVDKDRVDPATMTMAGLEALEETIPEVLVQAIADKNRVRIKVGVSERDFSSEVHALWAVGPHIREVFGFVLGHVELSDDERRDCEYAIVEAILGTLDPHTNLLRPDAFRSMKTSTKGSFGGLGIEIGVRESALTIVRVIDGNPADKVGMKAGDRIVQIEEESTVSMDIDTAVSLLRGPPGTTITVYVRREGLETPKKFTITRDVIKLENVFGDVLPATDSQGRQSKVGLVRIVRNFAQTTGQELREKLREFEKAHVRGVILDMRGNPGGLLNAAVEVADAFLSSGTIVSTVGTSSPREESRADNRYDFPELPVVVLVDQSSASATEIVAGALRNLDRAVVIGRRTFGKGSVQVLHDRRVGEEELALKLTIAQYLIPGDVSIQSVGVSPDLETRPVFIGRERVVYFATKFIDLVREESLAAHLNHRSAKAQKPVAGPLYFLQPQSLDANDETSESNPRPQTEKNPAKRAKLWLDDPEIRIARDLVMASPSGKRQDMLAHLNEFWQQQSKLEDETIAKSLKKRNIDWTPPPMMEQIAGKAELVVSISTDRKDNVIRGGESGTVTVTVSNQGNAPAYRVTAITDSDYSYFDERELIFGRIDPGQTRSESFKLSVAEYELSRTDRIDFHFSEANNTKISNPGATSLDISAEALPHPHFTLGYQIIDDPTKHPKIKGNGDGLLQVGESVRLQVWVKNDGPGDATDARVSIQNSTDDGLFLNNARKKIGPLATSASTSVDLSFDVRRLPKDGESNLQLTITDKKGESLSQEIVLPIAEHSPEWIKVSSKTKVSKGGIDLYASASNDAPIIARSAPDSNYPIVAENGDWTRIDLGKSNLGFIRSKDVITGKSSRNRRPPALLYTVSPPKITLVDTTTQTDEKSIHISGEATDRRELRDVFITVVNPSRDLFGRPEKVFYQASENPSKGHLEFAADIPLTPGNNLIEIFARKDDDIISRKRMWVLRTSGLAEARSKTRVSSHGQLSVDTLQPRGK